MPGTGVVTSGINCQLSSTTSSNSSYLLTSGDIGYTIVAQVASEWALEFIDEQRSKRGRDRRARDVVVGDAGQFGAACVVRERSGGPDVAGLDRNLVAHPDELRVCLAPV